MKMTIKLIFTLFQATVQNCRGCVEILRFKENSGHQGGDHSFSEALCGLLCRYGEDIHTSDTNVQTHTNMHEANTHAYTHTHKYTHINIHTHTHIHNANYK